MKRDWEPNVFENKSKTVQKSLDFKKKKSSNDWKFLITLFENSSKCLQVNFLKKWKYPTLKSHVSKSEFLTLLGRFQQIARTIWQFSGKSDRPLKFSCLEIPIKFVKILKILFIVLALKHNSTFPHTPLLPNINQLNSFKVLFFGFVLFQVEFSFPWLLSNKHNPCKLCLFSTFPFKNLSY